MLGFSEHQTKFIFSRRFPAALIILCRQHRRWYGTPSPWINILCLAGNLTNLQDSVSGERSRHAASTDTPTFFNIILFIVFRCWEREKCSFCRIWQVKQDAKLAVSIPYIGCWITEIRVWHAFYWKWISRSWGNLAFSFTGVKVIGSFKVVLKIGVENDIRLVHLIYVDRLIAFSGRKFFCGKITICSCFFIHLLIN